MEETLKPGSGRTFSFASGEYDMLLSDCEGEPLLEEYSIDLTSDQTFSFTG